MLKPITDCACVQAICDYNKAEIWNRKFYIRLYRK